MTAGFYLLRHSAEGVLTTKVRLTRGSMVVGRSVECDLYLADRSVSRRHAELTITDTAVTVRDLKSRNGTFVNGNKIAETIAFPRERVMFGKVEFILSDRPDLDVSGKSAEDTADTRNLPLSDDVALPLSKLSDAQRRVFDLFIAGASERKIAEKFGLSQHTVHNHVRGIYDIFDVHSRAELLIRVLPRTE